MIPPSRYHANLTNRRPVIILMHPSPPAHTVRLSAFEFPVPRVGNHGGIGLQVNGHDEDKMIPGVPVIDFPLRSKATSAMSGLLTNSAAMYSMSAALSR